MYTGMRCGTYSVWLGGKDDAIISKLELYYKKYPENMPEYIYVSKLEDEKWEEGIWNAFASRHGYQIHESDISIKLEKIY